MSHQNPTIIITGGHLTPALATIHQLKKHSLDIVFVGRTHTGPLTSAARESQFARDLGLSFEELDPPKLHRKPLFLNLGQLPKLTSSLFKAHSIITTHQPKLILSFGGYLALPLALAAYLKHIPVLTHEQTTVMGLTNRLISRFSSVAISWPQTRFSPSKAILTGNPIRPEFLKSPKKPDWYQNPHQLPLLFVTGGNQGAHAINQQIFTDLARLTSTYYLVHQTGNSNSKADFKLSQKLHRQLSIKSQKNYHSQPWFSASEISWLFKHANLVISRSGANTITELLLTNSQSLLVPLPIAGANEQLHNAQLLEKLGLATILPQGKLNQLLPSINSTLATKPKLNRSQIDYLTSLHANAASKLSHLAIKCALLA